jgi:hypothetical protein
MPSILTIKKLPHIIKKSIVRSLKANFSDLEKKVGVQSTPAKIGKIKNCHGQALQADSASFQWYAGKRHF